LFERMETCRLATHHTLRGVRMMIILILIVAIAWFWLGYDLGRFVERNK